MAPARNARAAPRALASPDISSRRRTTRSRLYGNRGPPYVRANSAASSRVRTVTSRTRRMGGWNTKSVMSQTLFVDRHKQARAPSLRSGHISISLLYHYYTTTITPISLLYYPYIIPQFFLLCARRVTEQIGGPGTPGNGATSSADHQAPWLWLWPPRGVGGQRSRLLRCSRTLPRHRLARCWRAVELRHRDCPAGSSAGCPDLARRLSGPALERMRERAHLMKTEQPCDLGYVQPAVIKVTNCQIAPQLLKYFGEVHPYSRKPSCKRPLAHSQTAGNVVHARLSMRKHRRDRVLNPGAQLAHVASSIG